MCFTCLIARTGLLRSLSSSICNINIFTEPTISLLKLVIYFWGNNVLHLRFSIETIKKGCSSAHQDHHQHQCPISPYMHIVCVPKYLITYCTSYIYVFFFLLKDRQTLVYRPFRQLPRNNHGQSTWSKIIIEEDN